MEIAIGAPIIGTDGALGTIHGMAASADGTGFDGLLVRGPDAWAVEHVVPLAVLTLLGHEDDRGSIQVDVDTDGWALAEAPPARREPALVGTSRGTRARASPSMGGRSLESISNGMTIVAEGTQVFDRLGQAVGSLRALAIDTASGQPTRLSLRGGPAFIDSRDLPVGWIVELSPRGIVLSVSLEEIASSVLQRCAGAGPRA